MPDSERLRIRGGRTQILAHAKEIVESQPTKDAQNNNLQHDPRDDGIVPSIEKRLVIVPSGCRDAAPDGLDDEAAEVGGQEEARVPDGRDARERRVQGEGDVLQCEVDGDADESRGEDDGADLELEGVLVPGVVVHEDATDVAYFFRVSPPDRLSLSIPSSQEVPSVSSKSPMVMAAPNVHVRFQTPRVPAARVQMPNATAKKMLEPRFGV